MYKDNSDLVIRIIKLIENKTKPEKNGMQGFINLNEHIKKQLKIKHWGELTVDKLLKIEKQLKEKLKT